MNFLAFLDEMRFLATRPVVTVPTFFGEFSKWENWRCIFKKHYRHEQVQFTDVYRCLFFLLALRRWLSLPPSDFSIPSRSPIRLRKGLSCWSCACLLGNLLQTLFLRILLWMWSVRIHFPEGEKNVALSSFFGLTYFLGQFPRISASASLLSFSLSWRSVLKFHSEGTSPMRNFDLNFTKRRTFMFSDVFLTQCSLVWIVLVELVRTLFCPSQKSV